MDIIDHQQHNFDDCRDYDGCADHDLDDHQLDELSAAVFRTAHNYDHHSPSARIDGIDNIRTLLAHYLRTGDVLAAARPDNSHH